MYKSPVEMLITEIQNQIVKRQDENIYQAVLHYIPNVDKEELLRALRYDRDQYDKGFADGELYAIDNLVRCKDCKHRVHNSTIDTDDIRCGYFQTDYIDPDGYCSNGRREA